MLLLVACLCVSPIDIIGICASEGWINTPVA